MWSMAFHVKSSKSLNIDQIKYTWNEKIFQKLWKFLEFFVYTKKGIAISLQNDGKLWSKRKVDTSVSVR